MSKVLQKPATYDDLLNVPEGLIAEIVEGELFTSPRPGKPHERAAGAIYAALLTAFDHGDTGPGGWRIAIEPEIHVGGDALVPDDAGWRLDRVTESETLAAWSTVPDWICEVISTSTGRLDRIRKMPAYARHGVEYAWLVDPIQRTVESYHLENGRWSLLGVHGGDDVARIEPFDAIELRLATLWLPEA